MINLPEPSVASFFCHFNITDFAVSPDENQVIFSTNTSGYYNLWAIDLEDNYPYMLTTKNQMSSFIRYVDRNLVLAGFDNDGDENWQICALSSQGGGLAQVINDPREKFYFGDIQGDNLYYYTSKNNSRYHNICRLNLTTKQQSVLLEGEKGPLSLVAVSPGETSFAYLWALGNTQVLGYICRGQEKIPLTPDISQAQRVLGIKYLDEDTALVLTNYGDDFAYLARFDLKSRQLTPLAKVDGHDFRELRLDSSYQKVYLVATRGVADRLYSYDLVSNELTQIPSPTPIIRKLQVGPCNTLYLLGVSPTEPANLYFCPTGGDWNRLTYHRVMGVEKESLCQPEILTFPSFDGKPIEALYYAPRADRDNHHTVLLPHGGPQSAERLWFRPLIQYLCYLGYRVFAPNYRGSSGYGEAFMKLVNKDWGGGPRRDVVAGMEYLDKLGKSHPKKWFCIGGSYGGYLTLLLHGRHPQLFKAFVDQFGPSNLFTTIKTAPEHWKEADRELIGDPIVDKDKLIADSPLTYLDSMTRPMLVVQGGNDPRVVPEESDAIVQALQEKGREVEYLLLPDEGHGYSKTSNAIKVYETIVEFLSRYLKG